MNRHITILALETLREQVVDTLETTNDYDITHQSEQQLAYVDEELNRMKLRVRSKDFARWLQYTMNLEAEELYGEFGYNTLTEEPVSYTHLTLPTILLV